MRLPALLLALAHTSSANRLAQRLHGDSIFDGTEVLDEGQRIREFKRRWGTWPPPALVERELPSYTAAMAEREAEAMKFTDSQDRWDAWMFIAQARLMHNFTVPQWEVVEAPKKLHQKLLNHLRAHMNDTRPERDDKGTNAHSGVSGAIEPDFIDQELLNYEALDALKPLHEAWAGVELEPTSVYGVRLYREGATLADHLDVPETHVISSIFHIDSRLREPYPIEIQDAQGAYAGVSLEPGQMMFYESAKCFHRRSIPMRGDYYGSLFLHYRPKEWPFSRNEIRYAVPPHWADGLYGDTAASKAEVEVDGTAKAAPAGATVSFKLGDAPTGVSVGLNWVSGDAKTLLGTLDAATPSLEFSSFPGHAFAAEPSDGSAPKLFTVGGTETFVVFP